jgi:transposase
MKENQQMSIKEAERLGVMQRVDKKILTIKKASEELGISERQTKRIRKRYLKDGAKGLISLKRGRISNRKIAEPIQNKILALLKTKYLGFGPTLASEKLKERNQITISSETLRRWLIEANL